MASVLSKLFLDYWIFLYLQNPGISRASTVEETVDPAVAMRHTRGFPGVPSEGRVNR